MQDVDWNRTTWNQYKWRRQGEEWSDEWGGPSAQWAGMILPRIFPLLPASRMVEIACGYGRWTRYLLDHCDHLVALDLSAKCVEACQGRFASEADEGRCEVRLTDGRSLAGVENEAIDLVFSFDSLVHVEQDVIDDYLSEIARVLKPGGSAFLHHSNRADDRANIERGGNRTKSVGAKTVRSAAEARGLQVRIQERVTWQSSTLRDCFTLLTKASGAGEPIIIDNLEFWRDASRLRTSIGHYHQVFAGER